MSCNIEVDPTCIENYNDLKLRRKYLYIIYCVSDDNKSVVIEKKVEREVSMYNNEKSALEMYNEFADKLPKNDCRYIVYDFEFDRGNQEGMRNKISFIVWSPDTSPIRKKMLYAASKDAIRRSLDGIAVEVQATDEEEVSFQTVKAKARGI
eukprot:GHVP01040028.1.p1 GENE.GHVP01040028.1~~GHVP01040028.1.p1  ORF type:complete len:151 (-),score=29.85 GHVP01040028.1:307-759(-)